MKPTTGWLELTPPLRLVARSESVAEARRFAVGVCAEVELDPDEPALVLAELATNALTHAGAYGGLELRAVRLGNMLSLECWDEHPCRVTIPDRAPDPSKESGRGLWIARQLAAGLAVTQHGSRKAICAMFDLIPAHGRFPEPSPTRNPHAPRLIAAGETFDVIEVDELLGRAVLAVLRARNIPVGPVLHDRRHRKIGFLIPPTAAADIAPRVRRTSPRHHGRGAWITFPPPGGPSGGPLAWLIEPTTHHLTDLRRLRAALAEAAHTLTARTHPGNE